MLLSGYVKQPICLSIFFLPKKQECPTNYFTYLTTREGTFKLNNYGEDPANKEDINNYSEDQANKEDKYTYIYMYVWYIKIKQMK